MHDHRYDGDDSTIWYEKEENVIAGQKGTGDHGPQHGQNVDHRRYEV